MPRGGRRRPGPRLRRGEAIYLVAAVALFALMFVSWFGTEVSGGAEVVPFGGTGSGGDAWQTLEVIPLFLMLAIVVAVGSALLRLSRSKWEPAVPPNTAVTVLGGLAVALILYRIVFPPSFGSLGGIAVEATLSLGVFLGLAAAVGIAYGGYRAMGEAGDTFESIGKRLESTATPGRASGPRPSRANPDGGAKSGAKPKRRRLSRRSSRSRSPSSSD